MRALPLVLVATVAAASVSTPALAAKKKPKPKPITMTYTASATPDPTSTNPTTNEICDPTVPTAIDKHSFTVPAAGTLEVSLGNQLDWSLAIRDDQGSLATSDGGTPTDHEGASVIFKKKTVVSIDTCNFAGEPSIPVTFTFTYK